MQSMKVISQLLSEKTGYNAEYDQFADAHQHASYDSGGIEQFFIPSDFKTSIAALGADEKNLLS